MHVKRIFLLEQRKCSYESAVETPDLGSGPTSDVFLQICVSLYFSQSQRWMRSHKLSIYTEASWVIFSHFMLKLFIYDGADSKI